MKTWVKILLILLTVAIFWGIVFVTMFMAKEDNVRNYSTYCMDKIRWEVSEYIWNVSLLDNWTLYGDGIFYLYDGKFSYSWVDYWFACSVLGKDHVNLKYRELATDNDELFASFYDNWAFREVWIYSNWLKQWDWVVYDQEWNEIEINSYKDWQLVIETEEGTIESEEETLESDED